MDDVAFIPTCEVCGSRAFALDEDSRWLCFECNRREEEAIEEAKAVALRILRVQAVAIHEALAGSSTAYRAGFEGDQSSNPYRGDSLDAALWRLGSLVALRGGL